MRDLEQAMKHIVPGALHVVVASRHQDGAAGLFYTRDPRAWLVALSEHCELDQVEVRPGAAATRVVEDLRLRFASAHVPSSALPWYLVDFEQALRGLAEYDLESGRRIAVDVLKVNDRVVVGNLGRGVVTGFTRGGRVQVRLDRDERYAEVSAVAPRSCVKPLLRAAS